MPTDPTLFSEMLGAFLRIVFAWQRRRARALGIPGGLAGSTSCHQRFGGALNANFHVHSVLPDGVFVEGEGALPFAPLPPPAREDIERLAEKIAGRHVDTGVGFVGPLHPFRRMRLEA